jgi:hypothetical protein
MITMIIIIMIIIMIVIISITMIFVVVIIVMIYNTARMLITMHILHVLCISMLRVPPRVRTHVRSIMHTTVMMMMM